MVFVKRVIKVFGMSRVTFPMASETEKVGQWAELRPELLDEVSKHVPSSDDYARLRAVCKSWNTALPKTSRHIKAPWLVLPFDSTNDEILQAEKKKEAQFLRLPELQYSEIRGSCFGWLITVGTDGELLTLNPFTNSCFLLPHLSTFPGVLSYQPYLHGHEYTIDRDNHAYTVDSIHMQKNYILKIVLSSSPDEEEQDYHDFMAVAIYGKNSQLAFYRFGDDKWTDFPTTKVSGGFGYHDVVFHKGKIYAIDGDAYLYEFDMKTLAGGSINGQKPPCSGLNKACLVPDRRVDLGFSSRYSTLHNKYLAWNPNGDLLMAVRYFHFYSKRSVSGNYYKTSRFDVYRFDESKKEWCREFFSLGDYVLMVGYNSSILKPQFVDKEGNYVRNCIYFSDDMLRYQYEELIRGNDIGVFNFEDGMVNQLFPNSDLLCPAPVWL